MPLQWDPDFNEAVKPLVAAQAANPRPPMTDPLVIRQTVDPALAKLLSLIPKVSGVAHETHQIQSFDGHTIAVHRYYKEGVEKSTPALVHAHGGGTIMGTTDMFDPYLRGFALKSGVQIFTVDYRLAPENPFPTPVEDVYAGLAWVSQHAADFSVDPARIGIMGESAGGNLAAAAALIARDRALSPPLAKQILVYPMLDDRNTQPYPALEGLVMWTTEQTVTAWTAYLGKDFGTDRVTEYAAPARAKSVNGLPPTYLEIGNLDIFLGETLQYASRISQANIDVELHVYPSLPHGYDIFAPLSAPAKRAVEERIRAASLMWL